MLTDVTLVFCPICEGGDHVAGCPENIANMRTGNCIFHTDCNYTVIAHLVVQDDATVQVSNLYLGTCRRFAESFMFYNLKSDAFHPAINNWIESIYRNGCREPPVAH